MRIFMILSVIHFPLIFCTNSSYRKENQGFDDNTSNQIRTWQMAIDIGVENQINGWVLYYNENQDSSWKYSYKYAIRHFKNFGYFAIHDVSNRNVSKPHLSSNMAVVNIYVDPNFDTLSHMIRDEVNYQPELRHQRKAGSSIWLIQMTKDPIVDNKEHSLHKVPLRFDSLTFVFADQNEGVTMIYDVYKVNEDAGLSFKKYATWMPTSRLQIFDEDIWSRRDSLAGHHFKIVAAFNPPQITLVENDCQTKHCFKGMYADVWHTLSDKLNFTFTVQRAYQWGALVNGSWNGMIRMLMDNERDLALYHQLTKARSMVVDYLPTLSEATIRLYLKKPDDALHPWAYLEPFTPSSWLGAGLMFLLIPSMVAAIVFCGKDNFVSHLKLMDFYWFVAQTLILRTPSALPGSSSNRIVYGSVILAGMMIFYYWEAMLISYLAVRKTQLPFVTLADLVARDDFKLLVGKGTAHVDHFKYSANELHKMIWRDKIEPYVNSLSLYKDLPDEILKDPSSVAFYDNAMTYKNSFIDCKIVDTGVTINTFQYAWTIPKNSPFTKVFEYHIRKLQETGLTHRYYQDYKPDDQHCQDLSGMPLAMNQSINVFLILTIGILGSMITLVCEHLGLPLWLNSIIENVPMWKNPEKKVDMERQEIAIGEQPNANHQNNITIKDEMISSFEKQPQFSVTGREYMTTRSEQLREIGSYFDQVFFVRKRSA